MTHRGSILLTTTWMLALLTLLAAGVGSRARLDVRLAAYDRDLWQARQAAWTDILRVQALLTQDVNDTDALNEPWARMEDVAVVDEQSKLPLNVATAAMLAALPAMDEEVADSIVAFRTAHRDAHPDDAYYATRTPPYAAKRTPFESPAELALVRGMTLERWASLARYTTMYPRSGAPINLNTASAEALHALGFSEAFIRTLLARRSGPDGNVGTLDDGVIHLPLDPDDWSWLAPEDAATWQRLWATGWLGTTSSAVRVRITGRASTGAVAQTCEAVLLKRAVAGPPTIVEWR